MKTGFVWHERYMWHDTARGTGSISTSEWLQPGIASENAETKRRARNLLEVSGLLAELVPVAPSMPPESAVLRFHTQEYVDRVKELSADQGGDAGDGATPFGAGGFEIAMLAVGGAIAAVDAVLDGTVDNCYALVRPPGHHARAHEGVGYCIFGNTALAAMHARAERGLDRVAIVDWDVHHGNGTQDAFYENPGVLTISLHQERSFPKDSGTVEERGAGTGSGYNINIPLPPGSGVGAYGYALEQIVLPALTQHEPELVLVACGFDANAADPLGRMMLHSDGYREMTTTLKEFTEGNDARLVMIHEGGYSEFYVPFCAQATIEALAETTTEVVDPFLSGYSDSAGQDLQPHQRDAIDAIAAAVLPIGS
jgi:acetoin utilization deacetylase AcuC-like enzyme